VQQELKQKFKYKKYQRKVTLLKDIDDIFPYEVTLPALGDEKEIINYGLPPEEQVFRRVEVPKRIKQLSLLPIEEAAKIAESEPAICDFIEKMWHKFTFGEHQYINGEPIWISPTYWFYLNFWKMDTGLPQFRMDKVHYCTDLWQFAFWDLICVPSDVCYGMINGSRRREGKTYKAMCMAYKIIISGFNKNGCLQSKTDEDAASAFSEKMVIPWTNLPFFFKPAFANSSYPKGEGLQFMPRSKKGVKGAEELTINPDDYLFSKFLYKSSGVLAADGYKWHVHVTDEDGKGEVDGWERWNVVKPCLTEENRIVGKEICTTTVEEMEKVAGNQFRYKWRLSDRNPANGMVNEHGETSSGLYQWFCRSRCNEVFDKFGCAIVGDPTDEQKKWLRDVKKDKYWQKGGAERVKNRVDLAKTQVDKQKTMRKYPDDVREMFLSSTSFCYFDLGIIESRLKDFAFGYQGTKWADKMTFGNFHWKDGVFGGDVIFIPTAQDEGRFWISYLPAAERANKRKPNPVTGKPEPSNWQLFSAGADPFKFDTGDVIHKNKMSDGAMHIFAEFDITVDVPGTLPEDYVTGDFCLEYLWRPDTVDELCEDYLKACIYYGTKLFPEKNNRDVLAYFKQHGFEHYLQFDMELKKADEGVYLAEKSAGSNTDSKSIQSMFKAGQKYIKENGLRCKFYRTLQDFKDVAPDDMNPYDLFVSATTCLRVIQDFNPIRFQEETEEVDIGDITGSLLPDDSNLVF